MVTNHHIAWALAQERQRDLLRDGKSRRAAFAERSTAAEAMHEAPPPPQALARERPAAPSEGYEHVLRRPARPLRGAPAQPECTGMKERAHATAAWARITRDTD